jgi:CHAT domain-containing protein
MTTIVTPGHPVEVSEKPDPQLEAFDLTVTTRAAVRVGDVQRGVGEEFRIEDAAPDDVIELEYANGVREWLRVDALQERLPGLNRSIGDEAVLRVPAYWRPSQSRGVTDWVLEGLKVFNIDPIGALTEGPTSELARKTAEHFESKLKPGPGLYTADASLNLQGPIKPGDLTATDKPYLLLLHGTFSTTAASFGSMCRTDEWEAILRHYGGNVLALEHRTLSESPLDNALHAAQRLPEGATVHLLSHSRGGLVGELLCRGRVPQEALAAMRREEDRKKLSELSNVLGDKRLKIERFVRVACPARGTILMSNRLDTYLSIILNLISNIPILTDNLIYTFAKATILTLIKQRADPKDLPGLEAMMPDSPLIRFLNDPKFKVNTDLAIVAGDVEGKGLLGHLGVLASDLFYRQDHDLVVNTESMFKGLEREKGAYYAFEKGAGVNHFNYFANESSRRRVQNWLTAKPGEVVEGFKRLEGEPVPERVRGLLTPKDPSVPVVFVIPDLMTSQLHQDRKLIWLGVDSLADGAVEQLELDGRRGKETLAVGGVIPGGYDKLIASLDRRFEVVVFPYDWRKSVMDNGGRLAIEIESLLRRFDGRGVHLLAHGAGGLVARALVASHPETWQAIRQRGGRLLMLGTPNNGLYAAFQLFSGQERLTRMIELLDPNLDAAGVAHIFRTFPGLAELLPEDSLVDVWDVTAWESSGVNFTNKKEQETFGKLLKEAKQVRATLRSAVDTEHMLYVAGVASTTVSGVRLDGAEAGLAFTVTSQGDGQVTYAHGRLAQVPTWYMPAAHGDLISYEKGFAALIDLLEIGRTDLLATTPPMRGQPPSATLPESPVILFPNTDDLIAAVLGSTPQPREDSEIITLNVRVAHGSLEHANYPVAVGHYDGDVIVGAEAALDRLFDGRLSQRFAMRLYPGSDGTAEVILVPGQGPGGALIIGLGEVGQITPEMLTARVTTAALRYALMLADSLKKDAGETGWEAANFSPVLIGTSGGRSLNIDASITAIVKGALLANRSLRDLKLLDRVRIEEIEFIELYEDIATYAAHVVKRLETTLGSFIQPGEEVRGHPHLRALEGGLLQRPVEEYNTGWWRRIQISQIDPTQTNTGDLRFVNLTDRARAEETLQATQRKLIDAFVDAAIRQTRQEDRIGTSLFELLLPNTFKVESRETANMLFVLDGNAAQYPWEMLAEPGEKPLSLRKGFLRQLKTVSFRPDVRQAQGKNALVIGDPDLSGSSFSQLPGARQEAEAVVATLQKQGYEVNPRIGTDALDIIASLFEKEYRLIHISGHGLYNSEHPEQSGVVIGNDFFLTAAELGQLRAVPELVFLNCCHLGTVDREGVGTQRQQRPVAWNKLAASVSEQLIHIGVRAVIAAGWAVDDLAALDFATEFYEHMLADRRQDFAGAILRARQLIKERYPQTNTWGAYQCYGDPSFTLGGPAQAARPQEREYVAPQEIIGELNTIRRRIAESEMAQKKLLVKDVELLEQQLDREWQSGEMLYAFGETYGELGISDKAINYYEKAIMVSGANERVPLRAIEQLANLQTRYAIQLRRELQQNSMKPKEAQRLEKNIEKLMEEAQDRLAWLLKVGKTPERLALLGSCHKRLALAATGNKRTDQLSQATEFYRQAHKESQGSTGLNPYHALNLVACGFAHGDAQDPQMKLELLELIDGSEKAARMRSQEQPSYWLRVAIPDAALLRALIQNDLKQREQEILQMYQEVFERGATIRERASALDQFEFLSEILMEQGETELAAAVKRLQAALG